MCGDSAPTPGHQLCEPSGTLGPNGKTQATQRTVYIYSNLYSSNGVPVLLDLQDPRMPNTRETAINYHYKRRRVRGKGYTTKPWITRLSRAVHGAFDVERRWAFRGGEHLWHWPTMLG